MKAEEPSIDTVIPKALPFLGVITQRVKRDDPISFLCLQKAPKAIRPKLIALHAFHLEMLEIPTKVSEAALGHMRFQWWHDALHQLEEIRHTKTIAAPKRHDILSTLHALPLPTGIWPFLHEMTDAHAHRLDPVAASSFSGFIQTGSAYFLPLYQAIIQIENDAETASDPVSQNDFLCPMAQAEWLISQLISAPLLLPKNRIILPAELWQKAGTSPDSYGSQTFETGFTSLAQEMLNHASDYLQEAARHPLQSHALRARYAALQWQRRFLSKNSTTLLTRPLLLNPPPLALILKIWRS